MSEIYVKAFFKFCRMGISKQMVDIISFIKQELK